MATQVITHVIRDPDGDILAVGDWSLGWSPRSIDLAIADIEAGEHSYVVQRSYGATTDIHVVEGPHRKYLRTDPDGAASNNLDLLPSSMPQFVGDHPHSHGSDWYGRLQGIAHSHDHWFFTQLRSLHKFHVSTDLESGASQAVASTTMPAELSSLHCDHFGDIDYVSHDGSGYILVPVEGDHEPCKSEPRLAVFLDDGSLTYIGSAVLSNQRHNGSKAHAGWIAFDPIDGLLYTSGPHIGRGSPVRRYAIDLDRLTSGEVAIQPAVDLVLLADGQSIEIPSWMQGGCFSPAGHLFIANGAPGDDESLGGIRAFDRDGSLLVRSSNVDGPFLYEYHSYGGLGTVTSQEPEGITYWDLDSLGGAPSISGQLHAILLNKEWVGGDEMWLKHFRLPIASA